VQPLKVFDVRMISREVDFADNFGALGLGRDARKLDGGAGDLFNAGQAPQKARRA
jgi:hypothetical protein